MPTVADALQTGEGRRLQRVLFGEPCPPGSRPECERTDSIFTHPDMAFVAFLVCLALSLGFLCCMRNTNLRSMK